MGSYPTHLTPAFSQDVHAGIFWSHRFFLRRQRWQAETFRKAVADVACAALPPAVGDASFCGGDIWESWEPSRVRLWPEVGFILASASAGTGRGVIHRLIRWARACRRVARGRRTPPARVEALVLSASRVKYQLRFFLYAPADTCARSGS
jgi:hypothetical protein